MFVRATCLALALLLPDAHGATTREIRMNVVDTEGRPIPGVHAFYSFTVSEGTLTGHGGRVALLASYETQTNAAGELVIPPQKVDLWHFWLSTNLDNPDLLLFKEGYEYETAGLFRWGGISLPTKEAVLNFGSRKHTVVMKRAADPETYWKSLEWTATLLTEIFQYGEERQCDWKKIPRSLVALDGMLIRAEALRPPKAFELSSPLRNLLDNDKYYRSACSSTVDFFEPYLRSR
jgi:hypothetical protein